MRGTQVRRPGLLAVVILLAGCAPRSPAAAPSAGAGAGAGAGAAPPVPSCREAWAPVPEGRRAYDFAADARSTPEGNLGYQTFAERLPRERCRKAWTVLVYMAADNKDMPPYAYWHLHSMEAAFAEPGQSAASSLDADVLVQLDLLQPVGVRRLHMMRSPEPYQPDLDADDFRRSMPADIRSPIVELLAEETIPPEESLRRFLDWGVSEYPADRYLVIVWGHGLGWRPAGLPGNTYDPAVLRGGVAFDDTQRAVLDTPGLRGALAAVARDRLGGRPIDVYASDACLMQSLEVATELADVSRYVVGSEQIEDYLGFPYRTFLPALNGTAPAPPAPAACPQADAACGAAAMLPRLQRDAFLPGGLYAEVSPEAAEGFTLSAVAAGALTREVHPAMHRLGAAIAAYVREDPLRGIDLQVLLDVPRSLGAGTPGFLGGTRDVGVFLAGLRELVEEEAKRNAEGPTPAVTRLLQAITSARAALGKAVIAAALGEEYEEDRYTGRLGASVWLPHDEQELAARLSFFASSRFYDQPQAPQGAASASPPDGPWRTWLELLFTPPEPPESEEAPASMLLDLRPRLSAHAPM